MRVAVGFSPRTRTSGGVASRQRGLKMTALPRGITRRYATPDRRSRRPWAEALVITHNFFALVLIILICNLLRS